MNEQRLQRCQAALSLRARLARRAYVTAGGRWGAGSPESAVPSAAELTDRILALDPTVGSRESVLTQVEAVLATSVPSGGAPENLLAAMATVLGVERSYLDDVGSADRADSDEIARAITSLGARGPFFVCRCTGAPGVAELLTKVFETILEVYPV